MSDSIKTNIEAFKRKFYLNKLIRGALLSAILFGSILLIFSTLEGFFWLGQAMRMSFLGILSGTLLLALVWGVIMPLSGLFRIRKGISDEQAALEVGKHFPEVSDKLLNYLQLEKLNRTERSLVNAALLQKTDQLQIIPFQQAVNLKPNLKYTYLFLGIICFFTLVSFISPGFLTESSSRILQFNKEFEKPAPFQFVVPDDLRTFKNESFELEVSLAGSALPENVFLLDNNRRIRLNKKGVNSYTFTYPSITADKKFQLEAAGFKSRNYTISVYERPEILDFQITLDYPAYTGIADKVVNNTGSLIVPEGSQLTWTLNTSKAESVDFYTREETEAFAESASQQFDFTKRITQPISYEIQLKNQYAANKSRIAYEISVIKDQRPELEVDFLPDTITFKSILLSGSIADDYGFKDLSLFYKTSREANFDRITIPFRGDQNNQQFFFQWGLDSLDLSGDEGIELYVSVKDNDVINGFKETRSQTYYFKVPNEKEFEALVDDASNETQSQFNEAERKSAEFNEQLQELEDRLRNKKDLSWQDEKLLEDVIKDKEELKKSIEELKQKHEELMRSQKEFNKQSEDRQKKSQKLQELIEESLDDETKQLYEELQKLLKEKAGSDQILDKLSNVKSKEKNLEKELERMKELFNRLKFETKLEQTAEKLDKLAEEQDKLAEQTKQDSKSTSPEEAEKMAEEQQDISEQFEEIKEDINESEQLNQELKNPEPFEDFNKEEQEIQEKLDEIPENLQKQDFQKAGQQQQNAGQKMKKMSKSMQSMQSSMEMMVMQENIDQLRDILDNLIKLSFEQEKLINSFQSVQQIDPRFIELSQDQLKLIDNSKVLEDSLLALASRVVQISNFVTREIGEINTNLDKAMFELRERNKGKATSHQQFAMTSMNNLALLLDDVLGQMQMAMAEAMGQPQKSGQKESALPDMGELQKQLSEQIQELKKSGKSGRELSEELARMAAEQAEIRRQLEEMKEKMDGQPGTEEEGEDGGGGNSLKEAIEKMEENEGDLVNKRLTEQLVERQQEILTRMLEAEESLREQKESPEREGETAKDNIRKVPPEFEEYLKARRSELELLKTIPLDLNPFYKKEVNDYFRRLSGQEQ